MSDESQPVRVALLTPPGRAAVATVAAIGRRAAAVIEPLFRAAGGVPLAQQPIGRVAFGHFLIESGDAPGQAAEEVVVCRMAPDQLEIHCHGGVAAPRAVLAALEQRGCELVDWTAWVRDDEPDPLAAAARIALAEARTERVAMILLDQLNGALRRRLHRTISALDSLADGGDAVSAESDGTATSDAAAAESAEAMLARLCAMAALGCRLVRPWRIVVVGRPNVGKSSLLNAILGYRRAIVFDAPGTTRDIVSATTAIDGWPAEISDTAGLRTATGPIEQAGVELARREIGLADLVLLVFDRAAEWTADDEQLRQEVAARVPPERTLTVHNKSDLPRAAAAGRPIGLDVSAVSGAGLDALLAEISQRLAPAPPQPGEAVPFNLEQLAAIECARAAAERGAYRSASAALRSLLA